MYVFLIDLAYFKPTNPLKNATFSMGISPGDGLLLFSGIGDVLLTDNINNDTKYNRTVSYPDNFWQHFP